LILGCGYLEAAISAHVLNRLGRPQVYDHLFAGGSRRQLVRRIRARERAGFLGGCPSVQDLREAMAFLDRIGWLTPRGGSRGPCARPGQPGGR
jgi:hypothetical protein